MMRVILFGGSFDPIHFGHFEMAKAALKQRQADALWFIPSKRNPFKDEGTDFEDRVAMIERMIHGFPEFEICDIEKGLPDPSYTIDTVKALRAQYPNIEFEWLIGSDQLDRMNEWKDIDTLKTMIQFVVYARDIDHDLIYPQVAGPVINVSSTAIREGKSTQTHPEVLRYMMLESLYIDTMLTHRLSQKRADHVRRVTTLACELAEIHHVDVKRVRLAALMHDLCKEDDKETLQKLMTLVYPNIAEKHPALYHAYAARDVLSRRYYVRDKQVLNAVAGHVEGSSTNPIGMILYIADKCEPQRTWNFEPFLELSKKDLTRGFKAIREDVEAWRKL